MSGSRNIRILVVVALTIISGAGLWLRTAIPGNDWFGQTPRPFPDDAPYHLIRVVGDGSSASLALGAPDPLIAHPFGDTCIWPWGFDWLLVGVARITGGVGTRGALIAIGLVPPILSVLTALLVFWLAARLFRTSGRDGILPPIAAAAFFTLMPANVAYTLAGRVDHHILEPVFLLLPLLIAGSGRLTRLRAAAAGLVAGLASAFFPAAPALAIPVFIVLGLFSRDVKATPALCAGMLVGATASLAASPHPTAWVHYSPSLWHIAATICVSAGLIVWRLARTWAEARGRGHYSSLGLAAASGVAATGLTTLAASLLFPAFGATLLDGVRYTSSTGFAALSLEASSFLDDPLRLVRLTGWLVFPALIGMVAMAAWLRPPVGANHIRPSGQGQATFGLAAVGFIVLAAFQRRFLVAATPFIAITAAFGIDLIAGVISRLAERMGSGVGANENSPTGTALRRGSGQGKTRSIIPAAIFALMLVPGLLTSLGLSYLTPLDRAMYSAADAIGRADNGRRGTLAPWGYGHLIKYAGGAPTVCDNFFGVPGADAAMKRCLNLNFTTDEAAARAELNRLDVRFVVVAPPHPLQIRTEASLIGLDPDDWADSEGRFTAKFAQSFQARTGMWAANATIGQTGPFGLTLRGRFRQVVPGTSNVQAEVFLLEVPESTGNGGDQ